MKEAGCRLLIVGYESGDQQILKNIKKGATIEMAQRFTANCKKLGLMIHGDFIVGLPGETRDSIRKTIDFAKRLDTETIQVSIAHPYPGHRVLRLRQEERPDHHRLDDRRDRAISCPTSSIPASTAASWWSGWSASTANTIFRPRVVWRIVRKAIFNNDERKRLTKEAREYMALRSKRKKFVAEQKAAGKAAPVPAGSGD